MLKIGEYQINSCIKTNKIKPRVALTPSTDLSILTPRNYQIEG